MKYYQGPRGKGKTRLTKFRYNHIAQCDTVIVLGGGPSTRKNIKSINSFIANNNCIVLGANYSYDFISRMDYTYFGDWRRFRDRFKDVRSNVIVAVTLVDRFSPVFWDEVRKDRKCYEVFTRGRKHGQNAKRWKITREGLFPHGKISPSGFAVAVLSAVFRPKKVILFGLDGPIVTNKNMLKKKRFDGVIKEYGTKKKFRTRQRYLSRFVLPFLHGQDIDVYCPRNSPFWRLNKKKKKIFTFD